MSDVKLPGWLDAYILNFEIECKQKNVDPKTVAEVKKVLIEAYRKEEREKKEKKECK